MSTQIIKLNKGDSYEFPFVFKDKNGALQFLKTDEVIYFAIVLPNQAFEDAVIVKGYTAEDQNAENAELLIKITPNDTRQLSPGSYYYTLKYQRGGTLDVINDLDNAVEVRTLIDRTKFIIYN